MTQTPQQMATAALAPIRDLNEACLLTIAEAQERGEKVAGLFCIFSPEELVRAAGMIPVSLCGKKEDPIPAAEADLPAALCPLIKSSYGYAKTDTCPFFAASDLIIGETTCDGKKKMFELLNKIQPVHVMQLPYTTKGDAAFSFWKSEMERLRDRLILESGLPFSDEDLSLVTAKLNRRRQLMKEIAWMMTDAAPPVTGGEMLLITESRNFGVDLDAYLIVLEELFENLTRIRKAGGRKELTGRPRIVITGCPMGKGSDKILNLIEEAGGVVVAQEQCSGLKGFYRQVEEEGDPMDALTRYYLDTPCACMSPNPKRMDLLTRLVAEFNADAVVDACLLNCHPYNIEAREVAHTMEEKAGVPCLHLETGYSPSDTEQLRIRIEAFLEML